MRQHPRLGRFALAAALPLLAVAGTAQASNGLHPRTPVVWNDTACIEAVDKSTTPVYQVNYDIPAPDTELTPDEVEDSRRHQFFALCRQENSQVFLPRWITGDDIEAAVQKNLIEAGTVDPEDVFETSTFWEGCWHRINGDDERRPITDEMASQPVPWDLTDVPEGSYTLWGYTWEPAFNIWVQRQGGIIKVHDGGTPEEIGPGATITSREQNPYLGDSVSIEGCVNAAAGSTMVGYYATTEGSQDPDWEPAWVAFTDELPVDGEGFALDFPSPEEAAGMTVMIRVEVTDPESRTFDAHMYEAIIVLAGENPNDCDESGGGFIGSPGCPDTDTESSTGDSNASDSMPSDDDESTSGAAATTTGGDEDEGEETSAASSTAGGDGGDPKGCGCSNAGGEPSTPVVGLGLLLLGASVLRRRR